MTGRFLTRIGAAAALLALAAGCAGGARPTAMVAPVAAETLIEQDNPLYRSVAVSTVSGGSETNPMWTSQVSDQDFKTALNNSLDVAAIKATSPGDAEFMLDATLDDLEQPFFGGSLTVTSTVSYAVSDQAGAQVWTTRIIAPYTASFSDAFLGAERLRLANEGSIKANIAQFMAELVAASKADPAQFGAEPAPAAELDPLAQR
ncbi:MAG: hypothetical protein AAGM38_17135 [Pseudomonadota bacterium]